MKQSESAVGASGANGTTGTNGAENPSGTDSANGTKGIDPEARRRFIGGSKVAPTSGEPARKQPWHGLDPNEVADKAMNLRTNRYERALLRAASAYTDGGSMQRTIRELIREGALARLEKAGAG